MNVLFFIVNYKADDCLLKLLESVSVAMSASSDVKSVVHVLDNSMKDRAESDAFLMQLNGFGLDVTLLENNANSGYFGGLPKAQALADESFDHVIYCNPDIRVEPDFFVALAQVDPKVGVVAPSILMEDSLVDQNPKYLTRLPKGKLERLEFIYGNGFLYACWNALVALKEKLDGFRTKTVVPKSTRSMPIYAPHGAMFVFSDIHFFKSLPAYPCFLFGEELFVAEEAAKSKVSIVYEPSVRVMDTRHASISLLNFSARRRYYHRSVVYVLKNYYAS